MWYTSIAYKDPIQLWRYLSLLGNSDPPLCSHENITLFSDDKVYVFLMLSLYNLTSELVCLIAHFVFLGSLCLAL